MSVKSMAQVWELDLPPNERLVLLAYCDHADHDGGNIYPAVRTVASKTGFSVRTVQMLTRSLEQKAYLLKDGSGPHGTNRWIFNPRGGAIPAGGAKSAPPVQPSAPPPVQPTAPEPSSVNHPIKPPVGRRARPSARMVPELKLFRTVTGFYPARGSFETVIQALGAVGARLGHPARFTDLHEFYSAWTDRGYNPRAVTWLKWAISGEIPQQTGKRPPKDATGELQRWLSERQAQNG